MGGGESKNDFHQKKQSKRRKPIPVGLHCMLSNDAVPVQVWELAVRWAQMHFGRKDGGLTSRSDLRIQGHKPLIGVYVRCPGLNFTL